MAKRRSFGERLQGAGSSIQPLLQMLMQDQMLRRRQQDAFAASQAAEGAQRAQTQQLELGKERRTAQRAPWEQINKATDVAGLPTRAGALGQLELAGEDLTPRMSPFSIPTRDVTGGPAAVPEGGLPSREFPVKGAPAIEDLMAARAEKEKALTGIESMRAARDEPLVDLPFFSEKPEDMRMFNQKVPRSQAPAYGALPQGPTPAQEGGMFRTKEAQGQFHPLHTIAKAEAENMMNRLTLPGEVQKETALTGARERAQLAPDIVGGQLGKFEAQKQIEAKYREPTEYERRGELNYNVLLNADANARVAEDKGTRIPMLAIQIASSPGLADINQFAQKWTQGAVGVPPEILGYVANAIDYSNTITYLRSGVQARENEFARYLTNYFPIVGDRPEDVTAKQQRRAVFHAATKASLAGNNEQAGKMLARAVKGGQLTGDAINALRLDPEVAAAFEAELAGTSVRP